VAPTCVRHIFNALGHPCTHSCQCTVQVTFCSAASITLLLWAFCSTLHTVSTQLNDTLQNCCGQSAVRYTLSAHNCTTHHRTAVDSLQYATHCQHTTARHITELLWTVCSTLHTVSTQLHDTLQNCCGQSAVRYTLSAHNCMTHYRTALAVHSLLSFTQSLSEGST